MKKMSFKKVMAAVAAMSLAACAAAIPASAAENGITLDIQDVEISLEDLAAQNYVVPIAITLVDNAGVNAVEYGFEVDDRCTYELDGYHDDVKFEMTYESNGALTWMTWAASKVNTRTNAVMMMVNVTVPADAAPGDVYTIDYVDETSKIHIWNDGINKVDYVASGLVDGLDGSITITGETTTEETTTTTEETTTTTEETTTTTEETTTTTEETTTTTEETTTTTTTAATTTTVATTTTAGKGSPATADATDILPIVGVAAAAAILGGVAIVSKKKDEE